MIRHALIALALSIPSVASAQICTGAPSLTVSSLNLSGNAVFTEGAKGVGGDVAFGGAKGFIGAGVSRLSVEDLDAGETSISATGGLSFTTRANSSVQVCPIVGALVGIGPDFTIDTFEGLFDLTTRSVGFYGGLAIGGVVQVSPGFSVIPNLTAAVQHVRAKLSGGFADVTVDDTGGFVGGGISLLVSDVFAIQPAVTVPVGFESDDPVFRLGFTVGFRR